MKVLRVLLGQYLPSIEEKKPLLRQRSRSRGRAVRQSDPTANMDDRGIIADHRFQQTNEGQNGEESHQKLPTQMQEPPKVVAQMPTEQAERSRSRERPNYGIQDCRMQGGSGDARECNTYFWRKFQ